MKSSKELPEVIHGNKFWFWYSAIFTVYGCITKRSKKDFNHYHYPSPTISICVIEPYNAILLIYWLLYHTEISILLDNEDIYEIYQKWLDIKQSSYDNLNRIISKVISSITASLRFEGELNIDLNEFQINLVPFTR